MTVPLAPSLVLEPEEGEDQAALLLIPTVQPGAPTEQGMLRVHRRGGASAVGPQDVPSSSRFGSSPVVLTISLPPLNTLEICLRKKGEM